jgi:hypothetical protein
MSETFAIPQIEQAEIKQAQPNLQFLRVIPGILLLAAIGYAGKLLEQNVGKYAKSHHWIPTPLVSPRFSAPVLPRMNSGSKLALSCSARASC